MEETLRGHNFRVRVSRTYDHLNTTSRGSPEVKEIPESWPWDVRVKLGSILITGPLGLKLCLSRGWWTLLINISQNLTTVANLFHALINKYEVVLHVTD